jgi:hypothetical protein
VLIVYKYPIQKKVIYSEITVNLSFPKILKE